MIPIIVIIAILLAQVIAHEAAHALAMRSYNMHIIEAGIGFGRPRVAVRRRGVLWTLSPWLLGAYVQLGPKDNRDLLDGPFRRLAWVLNAGVLVNLSVGLAALTAGALLGGRTVAAAVAGMLLGLVLVFRRAVATYVIPLLGPFLLVAVLFVLGRAMFAGEVTGMTGLAPMGREAVDLQFVLTWIGSTGVGLFALNAMPLGGLDGGQVWRRIVRDRSGERAAEWFTSAGNLTIYVIMGYAVIRDLVNIAF